MYRMLGSADPFDALCAAADRNRDDKLGLGELVALHREGDRDGDGALSLASIRPTEGRPGRGPGADAGRRAGAEGEEGYDGPVEGSEAPDFTLRPPGGGDPVTLSSFKGDKPVALVFGSYT